MAITQPAPSIDLLLNLVPDNARAVLASISQHPRLADEKDSAGYSLLHAAISYSELDLARALVHNYGVDPNTVDNDGETCLYAAEDVQAAKCAVEELGTSLTWLNEGEKKMAEEKIEEDGDFPEVVAYLKQMRESNLAQHSTRLEQGRQTEESTTNEVASPRNTNDVHPPPPLPQGVKINVGTMAEDAEEAGEPDPAFKRRIEELAARQDFQSEDGQRELRSLVTDAVSGLTRESNPRNTKARNG